MAKATFADIRPGVAVALLMLANHLSYGMTETADGYGDSFMERAHGSGTQRIFNAYTSWVYAALALHILWRLAYVGKVRWPKTMGVEAAVLGWFAYFSYRWHTDQQRWAGSEDIWCVTFLCASCLSRYIVPDSEGRAAVFTWIPMLVLAIDRRVHAPDTGDGVPGNTEIIGVLAYILLYYSVAKQQYWQALAFGLAFLLKVLDMSVFSDHAVHPLLSGTGWFHLLTGTAMFLHYSHLFTDPPYKDK